MLLKKNILTLFYLDIGRGKLTVGKIYGGLLILENWKSSKFGNVPVQKVSFSLVAEREHV